ncbi:hypothetical protein CcaverHIS641_0309590 [Cutaneotrichosporon cavernicola]|nr:hypothetical protein CcaverHIS641_0309590 [Cutaneotrichosporon cavernicola]
MFNKIFQRRLVRLKASGPPSAPSSDIVDEAAHVQIPDAQAGWPPGPTTGADPGRDAKTGALNVLDSQAYPTILDNIIQLAPYSSLLLLRATSHSTRRRVDARLCAHLVISEPKDDREVGHHFYTMTAPKRYGTRDNLHLHTIAAQKWCEPVHNLRIPGFAFHEASVDYHIDWISWFEWNNSDRRISPFKPMGGKEAGRSEPRVNRAKEWCNEALKTTKVLDIEGNVSAALEHLRLNPHTVRAFPDKYEQMYDVNISCHNLLLDISLHNRYHWREGNTFLNLASNRGPLALISAYPWDVRRLTLWVRIYAHSPHEGQVIRGFVPYYGLRDVVVVLKHYNENTPEAIPHSRPCGILADMIEKLVPNLATTRLTVVGIDPASSLALGVAKVAFRPDEDMAKNKTADGRTQSYQSWYWDELCTILRDKFLDMVAEKVRKYHGLEWMERFANVRAMDSQEWEAEARASGKPCDTTLETTLCTT